ncbi:uncharacterized protein LOC130994078 [Salvia miltiorrhiza]|uniref:uncharacterized protein LOC130994078 n=1 Tax=Salvia miltiorrhiza TaxID=226208 RepID=UPI0025AD8F8C|nr:uncharacterized protein LOC130994078 [Salvia miltiorrhiza]
MVRESKALGSAGHEAALTGAVGGARSAGMWRVAERCGVLAVGGWAGRGVAGRGVSGRGGSAGGGVAGWSWRLAALAALVWLGGLGGLAALAALAWLGRLSGLACALTGVAGSAGRVRVAVLAALTGWAAVGGWAGRFRVCGVDGCVAGRGGWQRWRVAVWLGRLSGCAERAGSADGSGWRRCWQRWRVAALTGAWLGGLGGLAALAGGSADGGVAGRAGA